MNLKLTDESFKNPAKHVSLREVLVDGAGNETRISVAKGQTAGMVHIYQAMKETGDKALVLLDDREIATLVKMLKEAGLA